jgi:uncharacterized protein (TIGR03382 family)
VDELDGEGGSGSVDVYFAPPARSVGFAFMVSDDLGIPPAQGEAFDADGASLGVFAAQDAQGIDTVRTALGDEGGIAHIAFDGGVVDTVVWDPLPDTAVEIFFDGDEPGVDFGVSDFCYGGSDWTGGQVLTVGSPLLYNSGHMTYFVDALDGEGGSGSAEVLFDPPVSEAGFTFSFSNDLGIPLSQGEYFDEADASLGTFDAQDANGMDTPRTELAHAAGISRISFGGGVVDTFVSFPLPEPGGTLSAVAGFAALSALVRRRRPRSASR